MRLSGFTAVLVLATAPAQAAACACGATVDPCIVGAWADNTGKQGFVNSAFGLYDIFVALNSGGEGMFEGDSFEWSTWVSTHSGQHTFGADGVMAGVFEETQVSEFEGTMQGGTKVRGEMGWDSAGSAAGLFCADPATGIFCIHDGSTTYDRHVFTIAISHPALPFPPIVSAKPPGSSEDIPPGHAGSYSCDGDILTFTIPHEGPDGNAEVVQSLTRVVP